MSKHIVELAQGPPSKERWAHLFTEISNLPTDQTVTDLFLAETENALELWPDVLRAAVLTENEQPEEYGWMWSVDPFTTGAPWLRLVRHVVASADEILAVPRGSDVEQLAFRAVRSVRLRYKLASLQEAARAITRFPSVQLVDLSFVMFHPQDSRMLHAEWPVFISALATLPVLDLNICRVPIGLDAVAQLVASRVARGLTALHVSAVRPPLAFEGARVLATWPAGSTLETLSCAENALGDSGAIVLGDNGLLGRIRCLDLSRNGLTEVFVHTLLDLPDATALSVLRLQGARPSAASLARLATSERLSHKCTLDLSDCELTDGHVDALLAEPLIHSVAELDLRANLLTDSSVERFVATSFDTMQLVRVEKNRLTSAGAAQLEEWAKQNDLTCTARPLR